MTSPRRNYKAGVKEALFMLSRGRCYAPKCPERVLRMVDDDPSINIQIAHIHGLKKGSSRYDEDIPVAQRNSFGNLLLLCQSHHRPVDDPTKEHKYTVKLLKKWKTGREGDFEVQLAGLDVLSKDDLETMLVTAVNDTKDEILTAIDEVAAISRTTANTLRTLVKESFDRPYLDLDAVAMLADSARQLGHLPDTSVMLANAAKMLSHLQDTAGALLRASQNWTNLEGQAARLQQVSSDINLALNQAHSTTWGAPSSQIEAIEHTVEQLSTLTATIEQSAEAAAQSVQTLETAEYGPIIQQIDDGRHWLYFRWGLAVGAGLVIAIVIFVWAYNNKGG